MRLICTKNDYEKSYWAILLLIPTSDYHVLFTWLQGLLHLVLHLGFKANEIFPIHLIHPITLSTPILMVGFQV